MKLLAIIAIWPASVVMLLSALALARIVGVGGIAHRVMMIALAVIVGVITIGIAIFSIHEIGWLGGLVAALVLAIPLASVLFALLLFHDIKTALEIRSSYHVDGLKLMMPDAGAQMWARGFRRYAIANDSDYWPDPDSLESGPNLRHALYIWIGFAAVPSILIRIIVATESAGYQQVIFWVIVGFIAAAMYYSLWLIHDGWAVRKAQILHDSALRRSLETQRLTGWLVRWLLRFWVPVRGSRHRR